MTSVEQGITNEGDANWRAAELVAMEQLFDRLWPLNRSLSGEGVRRTHAVLKEMLPLQTFEVPSGTQVFDWTVPPEWNVKAAYIEGPDGRRVVDWENHNLHLLGYSRPFSGEMSLAELDEHLFSLPEQPTAIPYVTSYYRPRWGFCLSHEQRVRLPEGRYRVVIDTELQAGSMTLSECVLPGLSTQEVLISTYTCHPSLANNELSGPLLAAFLYRRLASLTRRRLSYRFVFAPETIGSIAYLHLRGETLRQRVIAGYVATCTGGPGGLTYKRSRDAPTLADRAAEHVLGLPRAAEAHPPTVLDFSPTGSDERQYGSPGFRLPVGSLMRTMYGNYPEYHTSLDDKAFLELANVQRTLDAYHEICLVLDGNECFRSLAPYGEPQLGRRGLYPDITVAGANVGVAEATFWVLNQADGERDLLSVAERSGLPFGDVRTAAERLAAADLIRSVGGPEPA